MLGRAFYDTVDVMAAIGRADTVAGIAKIFQAAIEKEGFESFAYLNGISTAVPSEGVILTFSEEWREEYISNNYLIKDPVAREARRLNRPFRWSDVEAVTAGGSSNVSDEQKLMRAAHEFGYRNGLAVPLHLVDEQGGRYSSGASMFWKGNDAEFVDASNRAELHFQMISGAFAARLQEISPKLEPFHEDGVFVIDNPLENKVLSGRERDVLAWAARGKTTAETSVILGVSYETASHHLYNCTRKLGAANRTHAVALAVHRGIIIP